MKIAFATLGCKINQYDTAYMKQAVSDAYHNVVPFDSDADVYVINTCTVTGKSDYQSRQLIRKALRKKGSKVIVTGCYAETKPEELASINGVNAIIGNSEKFNIINYLEVSKASNKPLILTGDNTHDRLSTLDYRTSIPVESFNRTRAFLKIQDGCESFCSYCIVPYARGKNRSMPLEDVIKHTITLVDKGFKEIVISGIHLGMYGKDLKNPIDITYLLNKLLSIVGTTRLRLSSIEPAEITQELIDIIRSSPNICKHLHIPLQSGDDKILSEMKRNYTSSYYRELIFSLKDQIPDLSIGTDVIVGFPGETEENFMNTFNLLSSLPLSYFHVFPYSPRRGTLAAERTDQINEALKKLRAKRIRELGDKKNIEFRTEYINKTIDVLVESKIDKRSLLYSGLSHNYIRIHLQTEAKNIGEIIPIVVKQVKRGMTLGMPRNVDSY
ncbi:MAG: tRNA (N(6)-L-threonylcarbamoyladenosine(37)-C(2))-methylthiotransferase MtaB [Nitrospirota bacterium]